MTDVLVVESDEAIHLARQIARRRGVTVDAAVVDSLRFARDALAAEQFAATEPSAPLTQEQQKRYDELLALAHELAPFRTSGMTADHRDMYDENGLPI